MPPGTPPRNAGRAEGIVEGHGGDLLKLGVRFIRTEAVAGFDVMHHDTLARGYAGTQFGNQVCIPDVVSRGAQGRAGRTQKYEECYRSAAHG